MDEFDVAVVVFCRTRGVDERDAENRAEGAVAQALRNEGVMDHAMSYPSPGRTTQAVGTASLSAALSSGYVAARPSAKAYKLAGLDAPEKEATGVN